MPLMTTGSTVASGSPANLPATVCGTRAQSGAQELTPLWPGACALLGGFADEPGADALGAFAFADDASLLLMGRTVGVKTFVMGLLLLLRVMPCELATCAAAGHCTLAGRRATGVVQCTRGQARFISQSGLHVGIGCRNIGFKDARHAPGALPGSRRRGRRGC